MKTLRDNSLGLLFFSLFVVTLILQAFVGLADHNRILAIDELPPVDIAHFVTSSEFAVDVAENWQSEYLQFTLFILATVWLIQRGSPESKADPTGTESDADQQIGRYAGPEAPRWARAGGLRAGLYGWSLGALMAVLFLGSWVAQAITGSVAYNAELARDDQPPVSLVDYVFFTPDFWNRTLQNWQSEFLAVASMVVFSVYLRQRGSAESKPVGMPHEVA